jgi:hypothetical protein
MKTRTFEARPGCGHSTSDRSTVRVNRVTLPAEPFEYTPPPDDTKPTAPTIRVPGWRDRIERLADFL